MSQQEQQVKTEFHLHTAETSPCGQVPGADIIRALAAAGFGAAIVTDHYIMNPGAQMDTRGDYLKGYRAAKAAGDAIGFTVLPGMEFRFTAADNDFLIYGMEEADFAALPDDLCAYSLPDFHAFCHAHGWLFFQAHPFRSWCQAQDAAYLDGVEVFNGNPRQLSHNEDALRFAREHGLLGVAGGDVHQYEDVRQDALLVPKSLLTPKGIVQYLRALPAADPVFDL